MAAPARVSSLARSSHGFFHASGNRAGRLRNIELFQQLAKTFAVFGQINRFRRRPMMVTPALSAQRQVQRRLSAELHNHANRSAALCLML